MSKCCRETVGGKWLYQIKPGMPKYTAAKCSSTETEIWAENETSAVPLR